MSEHPAQPRPGTVVDIYATRTPRAPANGHINYPLRASCAECGAPVVCADGTADWAHARPPVPVFVIEKQSYSRGAWRVLDADGHQVWRDEVFDHPFLGKTVIAGPVCFDRKRDAVAWVDAQTS